MRLQIAEEQRLRVQDGWRAQFPVHIHPGLDTARTKLMQCHRECTGPTVWEMGWNWSGQQLPSDRGRNRTVFCFCEPRWGFTTMTPFMTQSQYLNVSGTVQSHTVKHGPHGMFSAMRPGPVSTHPYLSALEGSWVSTPAGHLAPRRNPPLSTYCAHGQGLPPCPPAQHAPSHSVMLTHTLAYTPVHTHILTHTHTPIHSCIRGVINTVNV